MFVANTRHIVREHRHDANVLRYYTMLKVVHKYVLSKNLEIKFNNSMDLGRILFNMYKVLDNTIAEVNNSNTIWQVENTYMQPVRSLEDKRSDKSEMKFPVLLYNSCFTIAAKHR